MRVCEPSFTCVLFNFIVDLVKQNSYRKLNHSIVSQVEFYHQFDQLSNMLQAFAYNLTKNKDNRMWSRVEIPRWRHMVVWIIVHLFTLLWVRKNIESFYVTSIFLLPFQSKSVISVHLCVVEADSCDFFLWWYQFMLLWMGRIL